jgi:hypothetical protein
VHTNFFVTFRSMTCRLSIFLEAAAGGPSRTFVRSSPRQLRATSRLSFTASDIFSAGKMSRPAASVLDPNRIYCFRFASEQYLVFDPFAGSGGTMGE